MTDSLSGPDLLPVAIGRNSLLSIESVPSGQRVQMATVYGERHREAFIALGSRSFDLGTR